MRKFKAVANSIRQNISNSPLTTPNCLTVISYNLLADKYATYLKEPNTIPHTLTWEYRAPKIIEEITSYNADILCLQEVERPFLEDQLAPLLQQQGYQTIYFAKRPKIIDPIPGPEEGCSLSFQTSRIEHLAHDMVRFGDYSHKLIRIAQQRCSTKKDTVDDILAQSPYFRMLSEKEDGAIIALLKDKQADRLFVAATTHLYYHPRHPDIKASQTHILCQSIVQFIVNQGLMTERVAYSHHAYLNTRYLRNDKTGDGDAGDDDDAAMRSPSPVARHVPIVVAGDFNSLSMKTRSDEFDTIPDSVPHLVSGTYQLLTQGGMCTSHQDHPLQRLRPGDAKSMLCALPLHASGIHLESAYAVAHGGREPPTTNHTPGFSGCLDYVLCSPLHFNVVGVLDMPYAWGEGEGDGACWLEEFEYMPNEIYPSDHLAVGAQLTWLV